MKIDVDALWDFGDPCASEERFRQALTDCSDQMEESEVRTQIARALGLLSRFEECDEELDHAVVLVKGKVCRASVRICLERGRCLNSGGKPEAALVWFERAVREAEQTGETGLEIDAIHMLAIADGERALEWNLLAVEKAESSLDPRARRWLASLYNNIGWTYFETGETAQALDYFKRAVPLRTEMGNPGNLDAANWSVARALRELDRVDEALAILEALLLNQPDDVFNNQEMALCLATKGCADSARPYAKNAWNIHKDDAWMQKNRPEILAQLENLIKD